MKKLLSILGSVVVVSSGAATVVACSDGIYQNNKDNPNTQSLNPAYNNDIIKAGLISRAKSYIIDDQFGFDDKVSKQYALSKNINSLKDVVSKDNEDEYKTLSGKTVNYYYSSFIEDTKNLSGLNPKNSTPVDITRTKYGNEGGVFSSALSASIDALEQTIKNKIGDKIPAEVWDVLKNVINNLIGITDGSDDVAISKAITPIFSAMKTVNVQVAVTGIPYALTLIPDLKEKVGSLWPQLVDAIKSLASTITGAIQSPVDNFIDSMDKSVTLTDLAGKTGIDLPKEIDDLLNKILAPAKIEPNDSDNEGSSVIDKIGWSLKLLNIAGNYLYMIPHDKDVLDSLKELGTKNITDTPYYKFGDGKTINIAPFLDQLAYYLSDIDGDEGEERVQSFLQAMFLKDESSLNDFGKDITDKYLSGLFKKFTGNANLDNSAVEQAIAGILTNKQGVLGTLPKEFKTPFDLFYNDWTKIGSDTQIAPGAEIGKNIDADNDLKMIFTDDVKYQAIPKGFKSMLNIPIYKWLALAGAQGFGLNDEKLKQNGLLPNYAGYYTQESITQLAKELISMFGFTTDNKDHSEQLKYHSFNFEYLKDFIDELLFGDDSFLNYFANEISNYSDIRTLANDVSQHLGYVEANNEQGNPLGKSNPKFFYVNSKDGKPTLIYKLVRLFFPLLESPESNIVSSDNAFISNNIAISDNLDFFFSILSGFVNNVVKPTDYTYWLEKVINSNYDNDAHDSDGKDIPPVFDYRDDSEGNSSFWDWSTGIDTKLFEGTNIVKSMTITIKFDLDNVPWLINLMKSSGNKPCVYKFEISREKKSDLLLKFTQARKNPDA